MIDEELSKMLIAHMKKTIDLFHHNIPHTYGWLVEGHYLVAIAQDEHPTLWMIDKGIVVRRIPTPATTITILLEDPQPFTYTFTWEKILKYIGRTNAKPPKRSRRKKKVEEDETQP